MNAYIVETEKLNQNLDILKTQAGSALIWGVVKGNGYGLGAANLALRLRQKGIDHFAVTSLKEVRALREAGLTDEPILMLRATNDHEELAELLALGVTCTLGSLDDADALETVAAKAGVTATAHVKLDTGMGRYGFLPDQLDQAEELWQYPHIRVEGIFTHFHSGSRADVTEEQFRVFTACVDALKAKVLEVGMVHCCNSLAFWNFPHMRLDAVRLGSCILGRVGYAGKAGLSPIGYAEAEVEALRTLPKGHNVGYGRGCTLKRKTNIAVVGVGYIHGFSVERGYDVFRPKDCLRSMGRYLKYLLRGKKLTVEIGGKHCPVLGHVGMVGLVADVTDVPCALHDKVIVRINPLDLKEMEVIFRE